MKSCFLSDDYESLEKVCRHVVSHHRNDLDVLDEWVRNARDFMKPSLPITFSSWEYVFEIVLLLLVKMHTRCDLLISYASFLALNGRDPRPVLQKLSEIDGSFHFYKYPDYLKKDVMEILLEKIEKNDSNFDLVLRLFELGSVNVEALTKLTFDGNPPVLKLMRLAWKTPDCRDVIRSWFTEIKLTCDIVDWFWCKDYRILLKNVSYVVECVVKDVAKCWFLRDQRLISFFEISKIEQILWECWNVEKRDRILTITNDPLKYLEFSKDYPILFENIEDLKCSQSVKAKCCKLPLPAVLAFCQRSVSDPFAVYVLSSTASFKTVSDFLKKYEMILPVAVKWSLLFAWRQFREVPEETNWKLLEEMSYRCDGHSVRRVLCIADAPVDWVRQVSNLVWMRISSGTVALKQAFLRSIPLDRVQFLDTDLRVELINIADPLNHFEFIFESWKPTPDVINIDYLLEERKFQDRFLSLVMNSLSVQVLDAAIKLKLRMQGLCSVKLLRTYLTNDFDLFLDTVLTDSPIWFTTADSLKHVLEVTNTDLFSFLRQMVERSTPMALTFSVYLLPRVVPLHCRYVVDPNAKVYEEIVEILRVAKDRVVPVYLYEHFNSRIVAT